MSKEIDYLKYKIEGLESEKKAILEINIEYKRMAKIRDEEIEKNKDLLKQVVKDCEKATDIQGNEIKKLRDVILRCRDKFWLYEQLHKQKSKWEKAEVNRNLKVMCEKALEEK